MIKILYFARLREQLGTASEDIPFAADLATVSGIVARLGRRGGVWSEVLTKDQTLMAAVNQEMARSETLVKDGDEVAFFPPVTGG